MMHLEGPNPPTSTKNICIDLFLQYEITPCKLNIANIASKNRQFQKETHLLPTIIFQGAILNFGSVHDAELQKQK